MSDTAENDVVPFPVITGSQETIRLALGHLDQAFTVFNDQLELLGFNSRVHDLLDLSPEVVFEGARLEDIFRHNAERGEYGSGNVDEMVAVRMEIAQEMRPHLFERVRPDGTVLQIKGTPLPTGGFVTTYTDVTEQRLAEEELRANEERLRATLEASPIGVAVARASDGLLLYLNSALAKMTGLPAEKLIGVNGRTLFPRHKELSQLVDQWRTHRKVEGLEVQVLKDGGSTFWARLTMRPDVMDGEEVVLCWIDDVTERRKVREQLRHLALHDPLTGLANYRAFSENLEAAIARLRRSKRNGALLYFDLDGFKQVNDRLGHQFGDWLLQETALRIQKVLRETDSVARLGGDEFAIILEDLPTPKAPETVAAKVLTALSASYSNGGKEACIGASIGIAPLTPATHDADHVIHQADRAMYRAKALGKGAYVYYSDDLA